VLSFLKNRLQSEHEIPHYLRHKKYAITTRSILGNTTFKACMKMKVTEKSVYSVGSYNCLMKKQGNKSLYDHNITNNYRVRFNKLYAPEGNQELRRSSIVTF
jgi:hypothetical protein